MSRFLTTTLYCTLITLVLAFGWTVALTFPTRAESAPEQQIVETYRGFAAAQNSHDLKAVGAFFTDGPEFLWVSDGQSYWGREAVLERMGLFQRAEHWEVKPGLDQARVIMLSEESGILHMPLTLEIGSAASPSVLPFLVSIVFRRIGPEWRIAALLTTNDKTPR